MVRMENFAISALRTQAVRSTSELHPVGVTNGIRTRDA